MSVAALFFGPGLAALLSAVIARIVERRARVSWKRGMGEVVAVERKKPPLSRTKYDHVVRFKADSGEVIELAPVRSRFAHYKVGQAAPVLFDPTNPRDAVVDELGWRWGRGVWELIGVTFGCLMLAGAPWDA